jgi:catechol 2,3-dioxygenase-like lactoylglutathione lyase family enzyme
VSLDSIGIVVEDLDRAREFYRRLGLELPPDPEGHGHVEVELGGGIRLMFDTLEVMHSFDPSWSRETGSPSATFAFSFETPAEVDAKHDELVAAGATSHFAPWDADWGMRYAILRDPDRNEVALYARLPQDGD